MVDSVAPGHHVAVFLRSYPDGSRQSQENVCLKDLPASTKADRRVRFFCPQPDWFKLKAKTCNLTNDADSDAGFEVRYFAVVRVGAIWEDVLTSLTEEEYLGLEFFHYPTDFFSLQVLELFGLQEPVRMAEAKSRKFHRNPTGSLSAIRSDFSVKNATETKPYEPYLPGRNLMTAKVKKAGGGEQFMTIASVLNSWHIQERGWIPVVVPMVLPIFKLLTLHSWACIPCLGRWLDLLAVLPPCVQCAVGFAGSSPPDPEDGKLSVVRLRSLMWQIQSWASKILPACSDEEEVVDLRCQLHSAVRWIFNIIGNLPRTDRAAVIHNKRIYSSVFLVRNMLATRLIPSYVSMRNLCNDILPLLFPNLLEKPLQDLMASKHLFPSEGSKHEIRLFMDVALLLWRRAEESEFDFVRFGGADSSPQHGHNWLLSSGFLIDKKNVVHLFHCVQRMIDESALRKAEGHVEQSSQSQRDHLDRLQMLRREHDIPAALGNRAESVGHKCAAMLHKFALRVPVDGRKDMLEKFTSSYFSFCADLGVEIGIGEFTVENLQSLLPHWLIGSNLESDVPAEATCLDAKDKGTPAVLPASMELEPDVAFLDVSEARSVVPPARPPPQESDVACLDVCEARSAVPPELPPPQNGDKFLPNALIVPGTLHIIHNCLAEVTTSFSHWQTFFPQLKLFEALWTHGRLQRFVNYCLRPSVLRDKCDDVLRQKLGSLYESRWGEVIRFCIRLKRVMPVIRAVWDERRYLYGIDSVQGEHGDGHGHGQGGQDASSSFDPSLFTKTLADPFFFAYFDMVLTLVSITESLGHWAESCSCHEDLILYEDHSGPTESFGRSKTHMLRSGRVLSDLYSKKTDVCPMRGKRLPELVAYGAEKILLSLASSGVGALFVSHRHLLSPEQWQNVLSDFELGKGQAIVQFRLKFDWSNRLPYKMALLAFGDQALQTMVAEFDSQPEGLKRRHHSLTMKVLLGPMRSQLNAWLNGCSLLDPRLSDLAYIAGCFRFVQITERSFEAAHSIVKRRTPPNARGH